MSFLIKTILFFIIGILLAETGTLYVLVALFLCAGIIYFLPHDNEFKPYGLYLMVSAMSFIMAGQDKMCSYPEKNDKERTVFFQEVSERIDCLALSDESKAVAKGILLGDKQALSKSQKISIREAGMSHILAVSGLHIGIIYLVLFGLLFPLRSFGLLRTHRLIVIAFVWFYVYCIGFPISSVRASLMLSIAVFSYILQRNSDSLHIISSAALIMLLYNSQQLWDVGFQLSFLAALGIIIVQPMIKKYSRFGKLLTVTLSAQLFTMPVVAYYFHLVPLFGWIQGLVIIPILPAFVYLLLTYLVLPSLVFLSYPIDCFVRWLFFIAKNIASFEDYCLGGKLLWYPTVFEACILEAVVFLIVLFIVRRIPSSKP